MYIFICSKILTSYFFKNHYLFLLFKQIGPQINAWLEFLYTLTSKVKVKKQSSILEHYSKWTTSLLLDSGRICLQFFCAMYSVMAMALLGSSKSPLLIPVWKRVALWLPLPETPHQTWEAHRGEAEIKLFNQKCKQIRKKEVVMCFPSKHPPRCQISWGHPHLGELHTPRKPRQRLERCPISGQVTLTAR